MSANQGREQATDFVGLERARDLVLRHIHPLEPEEVPLLSSAGRILARDLTAKVDSPSGDVSLKDGYALRAEDTIRASGQTPAGLRVSGSRFAGQSGGGGAAPGACVKITSGAVLPAGADAVVGVEYCEEIREGVLVLAPVPPGMNVLARGTDIRAGASLGRSGDRLSPGAVGWLAAAGIDRVPVHRLPIVSLVATGDEVVAPGTSLKPGQLYASNLFTLSAWLAAFGIVAELKILPDSRDALKVGLPGALEGRDALLTSGGAWGSERDLVVGVLQELGWRKVFHRVRMGPGKAVGFGMLEGAPVFCLPGGPPSNEMAFLQLALPGVLSLAGWCRCPFPSLSARLTETVKGREIDWTQFKRGRLCEGRDGTLLVSPYRPASRLESMALADCLIVVPEGVERIEKGQWVKVQVLNQPAGPFPTG